MADLDRVGGILYARRERSSPPKVVRAAADRGRRRIATANPLPKSGTGRQVDQNSETNLLRIIRLPLVCTGAWRV